MPRSYKKSGQNRSAFIRTMPSASVAEVVAAARKQGIKGLKPGLVYAVRAAGKKDKPNGHKPGPAPKGGLEQQFVDAVLDVGIGRASELLERVRTAVRQLG